MQVRKNRTCGQLRQDTKRPYEVVFLSVLVTMYLHQQTMRATHDRILPLWRVLFFFILHSNNFGQKKDYKRKQPTSGQEYRFARCRFFSEKLACDVAHLSPLELLRLRLTVTTLQPSCCLKPWLPVDDVHDTCATSYARFSQKWRHL